MFPRRFVFIAAMVVSCSALGMTAWAQEGKAGKAGKSTRYCRFQAGDTIAYGIVEGEQIRRLDGDLFGKWRATDRTYPLSSVKLLVPSARPTQVLALAGNYKSHLGGGSHVTTVTTTTKVTTDAQTGQTTSESTTTTESEKPGEIPARFRIPQVFFKSPSCLVASGENIVIPQGTKEVHYEAELVIVIGRRARNVSEAEAKDYILGVACGNDVSARDWQDNDVQWWRAKGSDTFGPVGPYIVSGVDYDNLRLQLRLNGKTVQDERTSQFIHSVPTQVSFISRHVTLEPGDLIFTGTPGRTAAIKPGDEVVVELEHAGTLVNKVTAAANGGRERLSKTE
jgi:2-keto-4-pentenoate hydratase/2-oxohepta-3-ene-1,7-dioic acid hydratase in catechol pathway